MKVRKLPFIVVLVAVTILLICQLLFLGMEGGLSHGLACFNGQGEMMSSGINSQNINIPEENSEIQASNLIIEDVKVNEIEISSSKNLHIDKKVEKYIDLSNKKQIEQTIKISENTPLDTLTASIIVHYSERLDVPVSLIVALIELESEFNQYEVGEADDRGYCQIIPDTEKWLANTYGHMIGIEYDPNRIFEPEYNIGLGTLYLYQLKKAYKNNYHRILSEYNRGPYRLKEYYNRKKTYETAYSRIVLDKESKYKKLLAASY